MSSDPAVTEKTGLSQVADPDEDAFLSVLEEFMARIRVMEPRITAGVCNLVPEGAELCRLDTRFKTDESLHRKVRNVIKRNKREFSSAKSFEAVARLALNRIDDALRYSLRSSQAEVLVEDASTFLNSADEDVFSVLKIVDMYSPDSRYKGLHANLKHAELAEKVVFEVQFHTSESLMADAATHDLYKEYRSCDDIERQQSLHDEIRALYAAVPDIDASAGTFPREVIKVVFRRPASLS